MKSANTSDDLSETFSEISDGHTEATAYYGPHFLHVSMKYNFCNLAAQCILKPKMITSSTHPL